jgi:hypothetical protein
MKAIQFLPPMDYETLAAFLDECDDWSYSDAGTDDTIFSVILGADDAEIEVNPGDYIVKENSNYKVVKKEDFEVKTLLQ